ncbi:hypothetical protein AB1Y20_020696 [Prymnesium parvum]|uniref:Protein kinase domain-containing protein n=1 Tax=Prymnesium parvum TaxID=97485 RepID=A0AB34JYV5_PRYPA
MQLLSGLFELRSKNLVHMDIKPGNIFKVMDARTQDDIWKLGDMDSVCSEGESVHSFTVHYSAPELARAELDGAKTFAKHKMDIWSAGLVVLEVATSEPILEPTLTRDEALHKLCSAKFENELSTSLENLNMAMKTFLQHMLQLEAKKRQEAGQLLCSSFLSGNVTTTIRRAANAEVVSAIEMTAVKVDLMSHQVAANASMLGAILQGEHDCPRWLVVVPKKPSSSSMDWLKPKSWLNTTVVGPKRARSSKAHSFVGLGGQIWPGNPSRSHDAAIGCWCCAPGRVTHPVSLGSF